MNNDPNFHTTTNEFDDERQARRAGAPWAGGIVLIFIGIMLLLRNLNIEIPFLNNWWALFILIPAAGMFGNAYSAYRYAGVLDRRARGALMGGVFLTLLAFALMVGGTGAVWFWPLMLIGAGVALLVNNLLK